VVDWWPACGHFMLVQPYPTPSAPLPCPHCGLVLALATRYGQIDGDHHKTWVIDQMVRAVTGNDYQEFVRQYCHGEDGPQTYSWGVGIAP
jgi:hypothetical protein